MRRKWGQAGPMLLCGGLLASTWRLRRRLAGLKHSESSATSADREFRFVRAAGVDLDERTRREAVRIARSGGVRVLDLVPADLPATQLLAFARHCDTRAVRIERLALGRTAGHAMLVEAALLTELTHGVPETGDVVVDDPAKFAYLAVQAKKRAPTGYGAAVLEGLRAHPYDARTRFPDPAMPWRPADVTRLRRIIRGAVWTGALPGLMVAAVLDAAYGAARRCRGSGNAYRVLAKKADDCGHVAPATAGNPALLR